jgi:hypothetical protein
LDHEYVIKAADGPIYVSEPYAKFVSGSPLQGTGPAFGRDVKFLRHIGWKVTASLEAAHHAVPDGTIAIMFHPPVGHAGPLTFRDNLFAQVEMSSTVGDIARALVVDYRAWAKWDGTPETLRARILTRIEQARKRYVPEDRDLVRRTDPWWYGEQLKALDKFIARWRREYAR